MKKSQQSRNDYNQYDQMLFEKPKSKRKYTQYRFEKRELDDIPRKSDLRDYRRRKIKGNQWEDWIA